MWFSQTTTVTKSQVKHVADKYWKFPEIYIWNQSRTLCYSVLRQNSFSIKTKLNLESYDPLRTRDTRVLDHGSWSTKNPHGQENRRSVIQHMSHTVIQHLSRLYTPDGHPNTWLVLPGFPLKSLLQTMWTPLNSYSLFRHFNHR